MPWIPELFSAPVLERLEEKWQRERLDAVPYYDRLMSGERDALIGSFAGEQVLHDHRPPMLQRDPELRASDVVAEYQRALAAGDVDAIVATFEPDACAREPAGGRYVHRGLGGLRAFYERLFSNDGGIPLEHCALVDTGRACALEYNVVMWGRTELPPEAGVAVYVRGESGKLAAARIYDDADPPLGPPL
jgi:SnoaL-like domain